MKRMVLLVLCVAMLLPAAGMAERNARHDAFLLQTAVTLAERM